MGTGVGQCDVSKIGTGGARRDRTADLYNAIVALSQLSYGPTRIDGTQSREGPETGQPAS
jgi:hypothetical protein